MDWFMAAIIASAALVAVVATFIGRAVRRHRRAGAERDWTVE